MSEDSISELLTMVGPLLGALVGGLITFFTTSGVESQKWKREQQEKLASLKREALSVALEWIEPMRNAETHASGLVMAAIHGEFNHEDFFNQFPNLLSELVKYDIPANQRAVLPDEIYTRGQHIIRELDELRVLGVKFGQEAKYKSKPMAGFQECSDKLNIIGKQISELETSLRKEFRQTFE
jgi:hypothetical protein